MTLPFQGAEVLLDCVVPLSGNRRASSCGLGTGGHWAFLEPPSFSSGACVNMVGATVTSG